METTTGSVAGPGAPRACLGAGPMSTDRPVDPSVPEPGVLYEERLAASPRSWIWLLVAASVITFVVHRPVIVPLTRRWRGS